MRGRWYKNINIQNLLHRMCEVAAILDQALEDLTQALKECNGIFPSDTAEEPLTTQPL